MVKGDPANIFVLILVIGFFSFIIYVAVQGRIEEQKRKKEQEK